MIDRTGPTKDNLHQAFALLSMKPMSFRVVFKIGCLTFIDCGLLGGRLYPKMSRNLHSIVAARFTNEQNDDLSSCLNESDYDVFPAQMTSTGWEGRSFGSTTSPDGTKWELPHQTHMEIQNDAPYLVNQRTSQLSANQHHYSEAFCLLDYPYDHRAGRNSTSNGNNHAVGFNGVAQNSDSLANNMEFEDPLNSYARLSLLRRSRSSSDKDSMTEHSAEISNSSTSQNSRLSVALPGPYTSVPSINVEQQSHFSFIESAAHAAAQPFVKSHACWVCGKAFKRKGDMERHSRTHAGPTLFCGVSGCNHLGFNRKDKLRDHLKGKHGIDARVWDSGIAGDDLNRSVERR